MKSFTVMTWTPHLTRGWRDLSVIFGQDFETNSFFDRDSIETRRDMSFLFGQNYEATFFSDRVSIHASRDMSVEMPPGYEVNHGDDLDTGLD